MSWPTDFGTIPANAAGTTLLADATDDHALAHRQLGSIVNAAGSKLGLSAGTPANNQVLTGVGNGSATWGTVLNQVNLGSPTLTAGTLTGAISNSGTISGGLIGTTTIQGGTANGITLGTPIIGSISVPGTVTALGFSAAIAPGVGTITDSAGGTFTVNAQQGNIFYSAMGTAAGNRTIGTPSNLTGYQQITYAFKASGSANGTLVWTPIFRFNTGGTPAMGTGATWNYYGFRYNPIDSKLDFMGASQF